MSQLVKLSDFNVIFLCYDDTVYPDLTTLLDSRFVHLDNVQDRIIETPFRNPFHNLYVDLRHNWYVQRVKESMQTNQGALLCVHHWSIKSSNRSIFTFDGALFPEVAYIFDRTTEHWFGGRINESYQLITKLLSRSRSRQPPINNVLDHIHDQHNPVVSYASDKSKIATLGGYELMQILRQLPLSSTMSPIKRTSPTPRRRKKQKKRSGKMNTDQFNRNNGNSNSAALVVDPNQTYIKNLPMYRMNNLYRPGTSAEAVPQDLNATRILNEEVDQTQFSDQELSDMEDQGSQEIGPYMVQLSRNDSGYSLKSALRDSF